MCVTLNQSPPVGQTLSVNYETVNGTAIGERGRGGCGMSVEGVGVYAAVCEWAVACVIYCAVAIK